MGHMYVNIIFLNYITFYYLYITFAPPPHSLIAYLPNMWVVS